MFGFGKKKPKSVESKSESNLLETLETKDLETKNFVPVPDLNLDSKILEPSINNANLQQDASDSPARTRTWFGKWLRFKREPQNPVDLPSLNSLPDIASSPPVSIDAPQVTQEVIESPASLIQVTEIFEDKNSSLSTQKIGMFTRLRERLTRTREQLGENLSKLFLGRKQIDAELFEELETILLLADVGVVTTQRILADLTEKANRRILADPPALYRALKQELIRMVRAADGPVRQAAPGRPQVILVVGVNGSGKTTTIGKLAKRLQAEGNRVMLAAGDTFRAAALEQLTIWGERNQIPVIAQHAGADAASVIFDALQAATNRGIDVLIADTAGRLHTKDHLMEELAKIARVLKKIDPAAPHEVLLILDATNGQNALNQAEQFHRAVGVTGVTLTKLDGTAKGGILFALVERFKIPIRFIGVGETIDDLRPFDPEDLIDAILGIE